MSITLGSDGLFLISRDKFLEADESDEDREQEMVIIRVRSGDIVQLGGRTRWACKFDVNYFAFIVYFW